MAVRPLLRARDGARAVNFGRAFTCCGCGHRIPEGAAVPLVGLVVMRRRRVAEWRRGLAGSPVWELVPVEATSRYPARACRACADAWPDRIKHTAPAADATVTG